MLRHPRCLEFPWEGPWGWKEAGPHHHLLMAVLIFMAMFFIAVGVTSGLL